MLSLPNKTPCQLPELHEVRVLEQVLDTPVVLKQMEDASGHTWIFAWIDEDAEWTRWHCFTVTADTLQKYLSCQLDMLMFRLSSGSPYIIQDIRENSKETDTYLVPDLPSNYFPDFETYYEDWLDTVYLPSCPTL